MPRRKRPPAEQLSLLEPRARLPMAIVLKIQKREQVLCFTHPTVSWSPS